MNRLERLSQQELEIILDDTEAHIHQIRDELRRRSLESQHTQIDDIALSPEWTPVKWGQVRTFFQHVLAELRDRS
ncbi:hypothetical protein ACFQ45_13815 [Rhodanobacter aciditrophus]|uniref:Uncharacterized protein n=1 Tax=Rhodanobacter aciditrophus TaxID=1623218 RepID=A0ABW4B531_9GAMM